MLTANGGRKLASLATIRQINPIPGADAIECAVVRSWPVVVGKGEYVEGDMVVHIEPDAALPPERSRVQSWVDDQRDNLKISADMKGAVFEVRQGYKSADSKRQNGDIANATQALGDGYLPVLVLMSTQINKVVYERYLLNNWAVLLGTVGTGDPLRSTFDFAEVVLGYDLAAFFERNTTELRGEVATILNQLLEAR